MPRAFVLEGDGAHPKASRTRVEFFSLVEPELDRRLTVRGTQAGERLGRRRGRGIHAIGGWPRGVPRVHRGGRPPRAVPRTRRAGRRVPRQRRARLDRRPRRACCRRDTPADPRHCRTRIPAGRQRCGVAGTVTSRSSSRGRPCSRCARMRAISSSQAAGCNSGCRSLKVVRLLLGRPVEFLIKPLAVPRRAVLKVEFPETVAAGLEGAQTGLCPLALPGREIRPSGAYRSRRGCLEGWGLCYRRIPDDLEHSLKCRTRVRPMGR